MVIRNAVELAKQQSRLNRERASYVKKEAHESADFIADSRKIYFTCTCGMSDEVWSLSGLMISIARKEWKERHQKCEAPSFHER